MGIASSSFFRSGLVVAASASLTGWSIACGHFDGAPGTSSSADVPDGTVGASFLDDERLRGAEREAANWLTHGRGYAEQRFSPLDDIDSHNISDLGLAWSFDLQTLRGVQATPIVVDGTMFVSGPWSVVYALDAATGERLWMHDPQVPRKHASRTCCGVGNRGVAVYRGLVFVGTIDGRLVALDANTGELRWQRMTVDPDQPYSITGAPRVVEGQVIIGNGGADLGVRGYVSAYDALEGELRWRTYTVPGDPSQPFESPAIERAAATWTGEWWKYGGGGTAWDAMAYDPELRLLYVGTGNGSPHARWARSPQGGDNLYLSSILALRPDTGEQVWHFQTTPADSWDYTATQHIVLAELEIGGRERKVLMQAPKNGFFFVLDRETGEFLSGAPYVDVNWAEGLDAQGRPIESPNADYRNETRLIRPSSMGGHNWQPMSFHPGTGLVYIPALEMAMPMIFDRDWKYAHNRANHAIDFGEFDMTQLGEPRGFLLAWDPVAQREIWRAEYPTAWNGGALATGGNLVFQGSADGRLLAYRASDGERLWETAASTAVMAGPVTYRVGGEQYVAVAAGWGGSFAMGMGSEAAKSRVRGGGRVLAFKLGGDAPLPEGNPWPEAPPAPPLPLEATGAQIAAGARLYHKECGTCHGAEAVGGGSIPDLRYADAFVHSHFQAIVRGGEREHLGMPSFAGILDDEQVQLIQTYVLFAAHRAAAGGGGSSPP